MLSSQFPALQQRLVEALARDRVSAPDLAALMARWQYPMFNTCVQEAALLGVLRFRLPAADVLARLRKMGHVLQATPSERRRQYARFFDESLAADQAPPAGQRMALFLRAALQLNCVFSPFVFFGAQRLGIVVAAQVAAVYRRHAGYDTLRAYYGGLLGIVANAVPYAVMFRDERYKVQRCGAYKVEAPRPAHAVKYDAANVAVQDDISFFAAEPVDRVAGEVALQQLCRRHSDNYQRAKLAAMLEFLHRRDELFEQRYCRVAEIRNEVARVLVWQMRGAEIDRQLSQGLSGLANRLLVSNGSSQLGRAVAEALGRGKIEGQLADLRLINRRLYCDLTGADPQGDAGAQVVCWDRRVQRVVEAGTAFDAEAAQAYVEYLHANGHTTPARYCELTWQQRQCIPPLDVLNRPCLGASFVLPDDLAALREGRTIVVVGDQRLLDLCLRQALAFRRPRAARIFYVELPLRFGDDGPARDPDECEPGAALQWQRQPNVVGEIIACALLQAQPRARYAGLAVAGGVEFTFFEVAVAAAPVSFFLMIDSMFDLMFKDERCESVRVSVNEQGQLAAQFRFISFSQTYVGARMRLAVAGRQPIVADGERLAEEQVELAGTGRAIQWYQK